MQHFPLEELSSTMVHSKYIFVFFNKVRFNQIKIFDIKISDPV